MRLTRLVSKTLRSDPPEGETNSHRLMLKAGLVQQVASGVYSYLPLAWRSLRKIENIIREEMDAAGGQELMMPALQPTELWEQTGRRAAFGDNLFSLEDRRGRPMVLAPTHEEVVTSIVRANVQSYRDLPVILYQIQTKFRDEPRPRAGLVRVREFDMKDAYSFNADDDSLEESYQAMAQAYRNIYRRCALPVLMAEADSGAIGGKDSHEFLLPTANRRGHGHHLPRLRLHRQRRKGRRRVPGSCPGAGSPLGRDGHARNQDHRRPGAVPGRTGGKDHQGRLLRRRRRGRIRLYQGRPGNQRRQAEEPASRQGAAAGRRRGGARPPGWWPVRPRPWGFPAYSKSATGPSPTAITLSWGPTNRTSTSKTPTIPGTSRWTSWTTSPWPSPASFAPVRGSVGVLPGHRSGAHLQAGHLLQRGPGRPVPGQRGAAASHHHGLLRHRRGPPIGRGHRAEPRRAGHRLPASCSALPGPPGGPEHVGQRRRGGSGPAIPGALGQEAWKPFTTTG